MDDTRKPRCTTARRSPFAVSAIWNQFAWSLHRSTPTTMTFFDMKAQNGASSRWPSAAGVAPFV
jgi:hypothetical protein